MAVKLQVSQFQWIECGKDDPASHLPGVCMSTQVMPCIPCTSSSVADVELALPLLGYNTLKKDPCLGNTFSWATQYCWPWLKWSRLASPKERARGSRPNHSSAMRWYGCRGDTFLPPLILITAAVWKTCPGIMRMGELVLPIAGCSTVPPLGSRAELVLVERAKVSWPLGLEHGRAAPPVPHAFGVR